MDSPSPKRNAADLWADDRAFVETEATLERAGRIDELVQLLESRAQELAVPSESAALLVRAAELARTRLKSLERAEALYLRTLGWAPETKDALKGLRALYEQQGNVGALVDVLERLAGLSSGTESASLLLKASELYEQKLSRLERAVLCAQQAYRADPREREAYVRARRLLLAENRLLPALESLERERSVLGSAGLVDDYLTIAEKLTEDPWDHPLAQRALRVAVELDPKSPRAKKVQKALENFNETWRDRVRTLRSGSLEERDRKTAARMSLAVARLFATYEPQSTGKVHEAVERCFVLWPAMPEAMTFLLRQGESSPQAATQSLSVLVALTQTTQESQAQVDLWLAVAVGRLTHLNDPEGARQALAQAVALDIGRPDVVSLGAELLLEKGDAASAIGLLEKHLSTVTDSRLSVSLEIRIADLCELALKDAGAAIKHLKAALQKDPDNAQAAFRLARLYVSAEDLSAAEPLLGRALCAQRPLLEKLNFCEAVSQLYEEQNDWPHAFQSLARALLLDASRPHLLENVIALGRKATDLPVLVKTLRRAAQATPGPQALALWRAVAKLVEASTPESDDAKAAWQEVLRRKPEDAEANEALRKRVETAMAPAASPEAGPSANPMTSASAAAPAPAGNPAESLEAEAKRLEASAADPASLAAVLRGLHDLRPEDPAVLRRMIPVYTSLAHWEELAAVLLKLAERLPEGEERCEVRAKRAQLCAEKLARPDDAARDYLQLVAAGFVPAVVLNGLERLASDGVRAVEISKALAPVYGRARDHQRHAASLLVQVNAAETAEEKRELLSLLAHVQETSLADPQAALGSVLRAIEIDPADEGMRADAERLAELLGAHAELCRALVEQAKKVQDPDLSAKLFKEAALVAEEGGAQEDAVLSLRLALERAPEESAAYDKLCQLLAASGRWAEYDQALRQWILHAPAEERAPLYLKLSEVSTRLKRPREAAQALEIAIEMGMDPKPHLERLCKLLEEGGQWDALVEALDQRIVLAEQSQDATAVSQLNLQRAKVLERSAEHRADAVKNYARILQEKPTDPESLAALESLVQEPTVRESAARALIPVYEALKDNRKLVSALEAISETSQDRLEQVRALQRVAVLHLQSLRQPELGFAALARALRLAPTDGSLRKEAQEAAKQADALDSYTDVLLDLLDDSAPVLQAQLHREIADIFERHLSENPQAISHLAQSLELDPKNIEALRSLVRLYRAGEQWAPLVDVLTSIAGLAPESTERMVAWREAAMLAEQRLGDSLRAVHAWRQVAERDPQDREAASALDRLYAELDLPEEWVFALELRRNQEGSSAAGRDIGFRLAQLRRDRLGDAPGALEVYRQILAEDGTHFGARDALEAWVKVDVPQSEAALEILDRVLLAEGEHQRRISLRESRIPFVGDADKARLSTEVRAIYERELSQPEMAFIVAIKGFASGVDRWALQPELERLAQLTGSFEDVAELYESTCEDLGVGPERLSLLRRAAVLREQLGQTEQTIALWKQIADESPGDAQALDQLAKLFAKTENARSLSDIYAKKAALAQTPQERRQLWIAAADAYESSGDFAAAIQALQSTLQPERRVEGAESAESSEAGLDIPVLWSLERLFGKLQRFPEQVQMLERLIAAEIDPAEKAQLRVRTGQLYEKLEDFVRAVSAYEQVLQTDPVNLAATAGLERLLNVEATRADAARLLEPVFRSQGDRKKLVDILEVRLSTAAGDRQYELLREVAELREALGQKTAALGLRVRAFRERPEDPAAREELERLSAETGTFEELAAVYEDLLGQSVTPSLEEELWRRLAVIYGDRLNRPELAARAWDGVLHHDPNNRTVLDALGRCCRKTHDYKRLAEVLRKLAELDPSVDGQLNLYFELGSLAEETLLDKALAAQAYQAILDLKPDEPNALQLLERVLADTDRNAELAQLLVRQIDLADQRGSREEALELKVRLGRLRGTRLDNPAGALALFQEILSSRPGHPGAIGALEEMARSESPYQGDAASILEPIFAAGGDHRKRVQMLEAKASSDPDPNERALHWRKAAELYSEHMEDNDLAFLSAAKALREVPGDERSLSLCLQLAKAAGAEEELAELLQEVADKAATDDARVRLFKALAPLQAEGGAFDAATKTYQRALELSPGDEEVLDKFGAILSQQGKAPELLEVLRRQLAVAEEPARRAQVLLQMATVQEEALKDQAGALQSLRRLLELKPDDAVALERMDNLCQKQQRWPELADVLTKRVAQAGATATLELKFRLAQLKEARLMDRLGAVDLFIQILEEDPHHQGALNHLEDIVEREPRNRPAVEALISAYRRNGNAERRGELLEAQVKAATLPSDRKVLFVELAQLRESQDELELAYLAYYRAFKEDPNDSGIRKDMERAAERAKAYDELAAAYEEEIPRIAEAAEAAEACWRLATLLEERLDEQERAVMFYEKARAMDAGISAKVLPALDRIYTANEQSEELSDVLEAQVAMTEETADKIALLFRLGQLRQQKLKDDERAALAYEKVLELDKGHLAAARCLEQVYDRIGKHEKLYEILKLQKDLVAGPERERVLSRMAQVSAEGLEDVAHSLEIYRELVQKNPRNEQAFAALDSLLEKGGQFEELKELLTKRLTQTLDPRELVRLNDRLGRVYADMLQKPEEGIPYFKAALERDPRHRVALESLRDIYSKLGRNEDLVVVLRRLIPLQDDASGVKQLRIRLAEVLSELGRREEALDGARRALEVEPFATEELDRVFRVFHGLKAYADAIRTLELRADVETSRETPEQAVATWFQIADLQKSEANRPEAAGAAYEKILELDPANRRAYEAAIAQYQTVNDWRAYAQIVDRYLPNLVTEDEKLEALKDLSRVQETRLGQKDVAFLAICRALQLRPSDDGIRAEVERLAEETESYEELSAVYEEVADGLPRGPLAERMYLVLAQVRDTKLDEPAAAEEALRKILEFDPTNPTALDALAGMFSRRSRDQDYIVALEQKLEATGSIEERKRILREIALVYRDRMQRSEDAASALLRALELEPDLETLGELIQLYRTQQAWPEVANALLRARDLSGSPEERARIQVEVSGIYERELQDDEAAVLGYRQALEFDPANREALDALEQLYTKLDRSADLLSVYERQLEVSHDYRERVKMLFKSANIWEEKFQNLENADACIDAVLQLDPSNLQAVKMLERLRRALGRHEELIPVLERHMQLLETPHEQAELLIEIGDTFHQELRHVDRAVQAYHAALDLDPQSRPAMHALGTLYERSGNWPFALDMLGREAQAAGDTQEAVELYHRMGRINEDMLLDPSSAKACYQEALRIDPSYLPCIRALKGIHEIEKDWGAYEATLAQEAQQTEEPMAKSRAMLEVARYHAEQRDDREAAAPWFEEAIRLAPDMLEAARPLADIYVSRENWDQAEQMLDVVVKGLAQRASEQNESPDSAEGESESDEALTKELCRQLYRLGYVSEKLGKREKALGSYEKAYALDVTYLPALEGLGNLLVQVKRYDDALKVYQTILLHHRDDLTDLEVVEIYWQLGDIHQALQQLDRAQNHFEKALSIDPGHEPSLRALISIADAAGAFDKSAEYRHSLVLILDGDAKFEASVELGKLSRTKLQDPFMAIEAFSGAHKIRADDVEVMDALYALYRETKQGAKAVDILQKMATHPSVQGDPQRLKRVNYALGEILRDELKDVDGSVQAFNASLDADHKFLEAFSAIEALLGAQKQWKRLEENYARMIQRLPKTKDTHVARMTLWRAMGDLYLRVLKQPDAAMMAYQVVAAGLPEDAQAQEMYAELAASMPGSEDKAVEAYRRALVNTTNPSKVASALAELAARRKDYDSAYLAAQVVNGLIGTAGDGEREILTKLTPYAKKKEVAQRSLTDRLWNSHLFHPKIRGPISELMALLYEQAGHLYAAPFTSYHINPKKHRIDIASAQEYQLHHYRYIAKVLGMEAIELYSPFLVATRERMAKRSNDPAPEPTVGLEVCHTQPVCLKAGGKFFSESGQKEVYYLLGRTLALLRPELALSQRLAPERLEAVFQAALSLSTNRFRITADAKTVEAERKTLEKTLSPPARSALSRITSEYVKEANPSDVRNYLEGAELTAVRTGLFVTGEIEPVKKMVLGESGATFRVPGRSKIRDLMVFALSEDLHVLRQAVGTHIEIAARK